MSNVIHSWLAIFLSAYLAVPSGSLSAQEARNRSKAPGLMVMPAGWEFVREVQVQGAQLDQFSKKLNVPLTGLFNTFVRFGDKDLQINALSAESLAGAEQLKNVLRKTKSNPRWIVQNQKTVYEFVVQRPEHALLASRARYAFPIQPARADYHVEFDAIPIQSEHPTIGPGDRNRLFNLLLETKTKDQSASIQELSKHFRMASQVELAGNLQDAFVATWSSKEAELKPVTNDSEKWTARITTARKIIDMPVAHLSAEIEIDITKERKAPEIINRAMWLAASDRFPVEASEVRQLVESIVASTDTDSAKLAKLLTWFTQASNMRYDGVTGSRYGSLTVLKQHFGRCWDYSDSFITLARAAGLPCRQVYGWLYESEGHVWCDILVNGRWQMVDPTTGTICGSDYLPFCVSASGEFPLIYASLVTIKIKPLPQ